MTKHGSTLSHDELYKQHRRVLLILFIILGICFISVVYTYVIDSMYLIPIAIMSYITLGFMVRANRQLNKTLQQILLNAIDLEKYRSYFEYAYKQTSKNRRSAFIQESYMADAQYYYFRGEFEQSLLSLSNIEVRRAAWYRRQSLLSIKEYYELICQFQQKDLSDFDGKLARYKQIKGKNILKNTTKIQAIYDILSGQVTDYFVTVTSEFKLFQIEAAYFQGLNLLNQDKVSEAKFSFASIVNENPDLFYVQEAKRYVEELD